MAAAKAARIMKELQMLANDPPPGVSCWNVGESMRHLQANVTGPPETPYTDGIFVLDIQLPESYPIEPPGVQFLTPVYHPNIDGTGRICLDTLKMRPAGSWSPCINISTLLTTIRALLSQPNGDDGLVPEITNIFMGDRRRFEQLAQTHTREHATPEAAAALSKGPAPVQVATAPTDDSARAAVQGAALSQASQAVNDSSDGGSDVYSSDGDGDDADDGDDDGGSDGVDDDANNHHHHNNNHVIVIDDDDEESKGDSPPSYKRPRT